MKKMIAAVLSVLTAAAACTFAAAAEESASVNVYVTIADAQGELAVAAETIAVSDADGDGVLTINDALYHAHEAFYDGGASAGYASEETEFGLSLSKLWGAENGTAYGYYLNHASALSLADTITEGDCISAFVYTDMTGWSDTYCYFDVSSVAAEAGDEITLTLSAAGYDANWNPAVLPVEGAVITIDGEATAFTTDAQGRVTFTVEEGGSFVISAVSESQILVPPVCKAEITADGMETTAENAQTENAQTENAQTENAQTEVSSTTASTAAGTQQTTIPNTGDAFAVSAVALALAGCTGAWALTRRRNDAE